MENHKPIYKTPTTSHKKNLRPIYKITKQNLPKRGRAQNPKQIPTKRFAPIRMKNQPIYANRIRQRLTYKKTTMCLNGPCIHWDWTVFRYVFLWRERKYDRNTKRKQEKERDIYKKRITRYPIAQ
jgi:hypothetical protein